MLEISEDQKLDLNSGALQRLLALEQFSFTLAMDDYGTGYSGLQRLHTPLNLRCRLGQEILCSKPFRSEQLDHLAQGRRKNLLKAAGTLAGKTAAAGARADVKSCRPGEPSQQIAENRTAYGPDRHRRTHAALFMMLYSNFKFRNQRTPMADSTTPRFGFVAFAETWNGRLAMLGFVIGLATELLTGQGILGQIGLG